jgi:cytochrome c oxidase assembly factor CtaG
MAIIKLPFLSPENPVIGNLGRFALYGLPVVLLACAAYLGITQWRSGRRFSAQQIVMLIAMIVVALLLIYAALRQYAM